MSVIFRPCWRRTRLMSLNKELRESPNRQMEKIMNNCTQVYSENYLHHKHKISSVLRDRVKHSMHCKSFLVLPTNCQLIEKMPQ